jgi:hypothetical protein
VYKNICATMAKQEGWEEGWEEEETESGCEGEVEFVGRSSL